MNSKTARAFLGIDIGSSSSKAVILDDNGGFVAQEAMDIGAGTQGIDLVLKRLFEKTNLNQECIQYSVVTGYGRIAYADADEQVTEITCHAKGAVYLFPGAKSVIDIGGQDAKAIRLNSDGRVENFQMNEKCAAGTGRFFEVMARVLDCDLKELSDLAERGEKAAQISSVCTVFAESEVISQLAAGVKSEDVAMGVNQSVARRVIGLCNRVGIAADIVMTGGVALNRSMVRAMEDELGAPVLVPKSPQTVGALGAAVIAREKRISKVK